MLSANISYPKSLSPIHDLYEETFDVVIHGAGYLGFAAARALAETGQSVLLTEPTGQLLWESTSALENALAGTVGPDWQQWQAMLEAQQAVDNDCFDAVSAEIIAAQYLCDTASVQTLLFASPVGAQILDHQLAAAVYATKEGFRRIRAQRWIDASERGDLLACLQLEGAKPRKAQSNFSRLAMQCRHWEDWDQRYTAYAQDKGMRWQKTSRATERHLVWESDGTPWHTDLVEHLRALRTAFGHEHAPMLSHSSCIAFPAYVAGKASLPASAPVNLLVLSPAFAACDLTSIPERYQYAASAARELSPSPVAINFAQLEPLNAASLRVKNQLARDVLVAGVGTAGALAAMAAGANGASTYALEFAPFPGGIGTGGGITGYFYGLPGGLQEKLGAETAKLTALFQGNSYEPDRNHWHHDAKKIAILNEFDRYNTTFCGGALLCAVELDASSVTSVLAVVEGQLTRISARAFVDSTGDGDLCSHAGADFTTGRLGDSRTLAYSQAAFSLDYEKPNLSVHIRNFDAGWVDATDAKDLSRARLHGLVQYSQTLQNETLLPLQIAPLLGIRESRHIKTDYTLLMDDLITERRFEDSIGRAGAHADTHSVDFEFEDDETVFFYWVCRLFRYPLRTQLPYRMLLPKGLDNAWIACRAAGMKANVFYGIRMQRDMQRLGEAAGVAAALATRNGQAGHSRSVPIDQLREALAGYPAPALEEPVRNAYQDPLAELAKGHSGVPLWMLYRDRRKYAEAVLAQLDSDQPNASFYAACILAMWNDPRAEKRLLQAIANNEDGGTDPADNTGAYGQEIDIPFWLLAIILLRCCGTQECVPTLLEVASVPQSNLNVRSSMALTLERLIERDEVNPVEAEQIAEHLASPMENTMLTPSHSIARSLRKQEQMRLTNDYLPPVKEDHAWQLHLVLYRIRIKLGLAPHAKAIAYQDDSRNFVRQAFAELNCQSISSLSKG